MYLRYLRNKMYLRYLRSLPSKVSFVPSKEINLIRQLSNLTDIGNHVTVSFNIDRLFNISISHVIYIIWHLIISCIVDSRSDSISVGCNIFRVAHVFPPIAPSLDGERASRLQRCCWATNMQISHSTCGGSIAAFTKRNIFPTRRYALIRGQYVYMVFIMILLIRFHIQ